MGKSRILVVGGTGYIGKFLVKASARLGHLTFVLARPSSSSTQSNTGTGPFPPGGTLRAADIEKKEILASFESLGVTILHGDINDRVSLVEALKQVDIVISAVGPEQLLGGQLNLIEAIKEVGHIKRFLPSEFGNDAERTLHPLPAVQMVFAAKLKVRQAIREAGIPYTFVNANSFAGFVVDNFTQLDIMIKHMRHGVGTPPKDKVTILGSGEAKTVIVTEDDIGTVTIKAVDDPRTLNKQLVIRPRENTLPFNSIVALWEKKLGHSLEKTYLLEDELLKKISDSSFPANLILSMFWEFVNGSQVFELGPADVDAVELYPDLKYVTVDEYLNKFV